MKYKEYLEYKDEFEKEMKEKELYFKECGKFKGGLRWWGINNNKEKYEIYKFLKKGFEFVEEYNNCDIYELKGKFTPYIGCPYYFKTLKDCKKRIDERQKAFF